MEAISGGCACASVRFEVDGPIADVSFCHCGRCRRLTGSAFGAYGAALASDFRFSSGAESIRRWAQSEMVTRHFCGTCGSLLTTLHAAEPESVFVSLGALDEGTAVQPEYHQYTDSKAAWHQIGDDLPRHAGWPPHHVGEIG